MPSLTIKNIPDELYEALKESAKRNHRSLNGELLAMMDQKLMPSRITPEERLERLDAIRHRFKGLDLSEEFLRKAKNEGRP